jgi:hypothetical protein
MNDTVRAILAEHAGRAEGEFVFASNTGETAVDACNSCGGCSFRQ